MASLTSIRARVAAHNNLLVVVGRGFIGGLNQSMIGVVFQPFVLSLGASMSQLGLFTSIGGFSGFMPTLVAPWGGWLADQRGRRVVLVGGSLAAIAAYLVYTFVGWSSLLYLIYPGIILLGASQIAQPANSALIGESVGAGRRGTAYSLFSLTVTLPGIIAPLAAGALADRFGFAVVFPLVLILELISFSLVARYLRETRRVSSAKTDWHSVLSVVRRAWIPPRELRGFFIASAFDSFSWGMGFGILYGLLTREYGFTTGQLGILSSIINLSWALFSLPVGRFVDRLGTKGMLVFSESLGTPLMLVWMTQTRFEIFAASMVIFALTAATWIPTRNTYIAHVVEPARRGEIFGRLAAFGGLVAFPSAFVGGFVYDHFGFAAPFIGNLIGSVITVLVLVFFVREPRTPALAESI